MINKINNTSGNNISFKRVVPTPALINLSKSNAEKLNVAIELINNYYPHNDVFIGADNKGELVYQIQKVDPSIELFNILSTSPKASLMTFNSSSDTSNLSSSFFNSPSTPTSITSS